MKNSNQIIASDLLRYRKNKAAANLALLAIAFNCLYFMFVYKQVCGNIKAQFTNESPVYTYMMGVSVIINLIILLTAFLSSERLKGYDKRFSFVVWAIAIVQIVRIFIYPLNTYNTKYQAGMAEKYIFGTGTFVLLIACLAASAACLIASGVIGYIRASKLEKFVKAVDEGRIDLESALKEETQQTGGGEVNA